MNSPQLIKVLLIEDDEDDYLLTRNFLKEIAHAQFELEWVRDYASALEKILRNEHHVCLIDYRLGAHDGLELLRAAPIHGMPKIFLTGQSDHAVDMEAMMCGAADYLVKGEITSSILERSIRYALERYRLQQELRDLSLQDELTGLHNRRGFVTLAEHELKLAQRMQREIFLFFLDLDGMKQINDNFGHAAGDEALTQTGALLRKTFRDSDIIARLGGDEFAILALGARVDDPEIIMARLQKNLHAINSSSARRYRLEISVGAVRYASDGSSSLPQMFTRADEIMYAKKQAKKLSASKK
ncbi:MAG: diguanylate cyclase [Gammaproteobacteria bacterium]|nr:diguanylate cyclase [Gammaproteobacteria bacterium]